MTVRRSQARRAVRGSKAPRAHPNDSGIRFGTNGWRGVLAEEVTFPRLRVLLRAIAQWIRESEHGGRVLIGWDGRFASRAMAEIAARVLQDEALRPVLASACTPTPAVTHALAHGRYAAGLVLTASHNPPAYHGLKVFESSGAAITDPSARRIEAIAALRMGDDGPPRSTGLPAPRDFAERYLDGLAALLDRDALRRARATLVFDAMHGAAAGYLDELMRRLGVPVEALRTALDPHFGGAPPDPVPARLSALVAKLRSQPGLALGIANDGDGDRVGVVDGRGRVLSETQAMALLVDHLATRGRIRHGVALGAATGTLVEKVALDHGLAVERHPIGFKYLSAAMLAGRADVAGEESGGFGYARMGPDKDGILAGALLVELVASSGEALEVHVERLEARFGRSACGRVALARSQVHDRALAKLASAPPERIGRSPLRAVDERCGLRFDLADGGFLMIRCSGTEPMVRIYAEAGDTERLAQRLDAGRRLLARAGRQ